jgi:hypothetical protein
MTALNDLIQQQLSGTVVQQISKQLGIDPSTAQLAVTAALPMILGGMSAHATNPANAQAIHAEADNHVPSPGAAPTIQAPPADQSFGGGLLGKVLGTRVGGVQDAVSTATGIDPTQAGQIIAMLTPFVMGALAKTKQQQGLTPADVQSTLQTAAQGAQSRATQQSPALGGVLGTLMNDLSRS